MAERMSGRWTTLHASASAGLMAGVALGLAEATAVLWVSAPPRDLTVLPYAAVTYSLFCAVAGAGLGIVWALGARLVRRMVPAPATVHALVGALLLSGFGFVIARFRVMRDIYLENLPPMSAKGLVVQATMAVVAIAVLVGSRAAARWFLSRMPGRVVLKPWGGLAVLAIVSCAGIAIGALGNAPDAKAATRSGRRAAGRPNVILLVVDTLRADHLGAYGYPGRTTPHLDAFARDAVRFDSAFAQASWTRPSFASILTGRYPSSHRTVNKPDSLPDEVATLAETLGSAGYETAGFVTNFNVAPYFNFGQGFDEYHYLEPELVLWANDTSSRLSLYSIVRLVSERFVANRLHVDNYYQDAASVNRAVDGWLDQRPQRPFFLFAGYMDPHDPYFRHPYDGTAVARVALPMPPLSRASELRDLYDGEIRYWDHHFGRLIASLKRRGLYEDTLIVVTSDHGEEFGDHGGFWHGTTLYDEQVRIPLIVRPPGGEAAGTTISDWVRHVDIAPTVLRFAGTRSPEGMQGTYLFSAGRQSVFSEEEHEGNRLMSIRVPGQDGGDYKLILANEGNPRGLQPTEMYNVAADPRELRNVAQPDRARVAELRRSLEQAARDGARGAVATQAQELDAAALERLRSLGYVGEDRR